MPLATRSGNTANRSVVLPLLWRPTNAMRGAFTALRLCGERRPALDAELRALGVRLPAARAERARGRGRRAGGRRRERRAVLLLGLVAERPHALADLAEHGRELPRPEDDEHDDEDEDELRPSKVERHDRSLPRARAARGISSTSVREADQPKRPAISVRNRGTTTSNIRAGR